MSPSESSRARNPWRTIVWSSTSSTVIFDINLLGLLCRLRQYRWEVFKRKWGEPPIGFSPTDLFTIRRNEKSKPGFVPGDRLLRVNETQVFRCACTSAMKDLTEKRDYA